MYFTTFCMSEGGMLPFFFLKNRVMLHLAMQCLYLDSNMIFECRHYFTFKKFCFTWGKIDEHVTTILTSVFKLLNEEFGTHSEDDWEAVLESLNKEKKVEEETTDHVPQPNFKRKYTVQRKIMMNVNSLTNLNKAFLIQKNWFLIHLRVRK